MAVGKSSLGRVARASVIPAPEKETEKLIPAKEEVKPAEIKPAETKKPRAAKTAAVKPASEIYSVGDALPVWLL